MKAFSNKIWLLALLFLPALIFAQKQEPQIGDTTYYKTLIPEEKQGLLKNMSMIANMRFGLRNEFTDGGLYRIKIQHGTVQDGIPRTGS